MSSSGSPAPAAGLSPPWLDAALASAAARLGDLRQTRADDIPGVLEQSLTGLLTELQHDAGWHARLDAARRFLPGPGTPVLSHRLGASNRLSLALVAIHPSRPLPPHDHPGRFGVLQILTGCLRVRSFAALPVGGGRFRLLARETRAGGAGTRSAFTPQRDNLHALAATEPGTSLLSLQFQLSDPASEGWYFPQDDLVPGATDTRYTRIAKPASRCSD